MITAAEAIRSARLRAGMTQTQLADELGTTQSAIARLESPDSNPTVSTLERVLDATGHRLFLASVTKEPGIDETLIAGQLRLTPAQRLKSFESFHREARKLMLAGQRARGEDTA